MYKILEERNLLDEVIFGTFNEEVTQYVDDNYPKLVRSANMGEVVEFYIASMINDKDYEPPFTVLQIPFCNWEDSYYLNFGTAKVINYAYSKNLAVQYWTINDAEDMEYLISIGADAIMSDYPDILYNAVNS